MNNINLCSDANTQDEKTIQFMNETVIPALEKDRDEWEETLILCEGFEDRKAICKEEINKINNAILLWSIRLVDENRKKEEKNNEVLASAITQDESKMAIIVNEAVSFIAKKIGQPEDIAMDLIKNEGSKESKMYHKLCAFGVQTLINKMIDDHLKG